MNTNLEKSDDPQVRENLFREFTNNIGGIISRISDGYALTTDHPYFVHISALATKDADAAGLLLLASLNQQHVGQVVANAMSNPKVSASFIRAVYMPIERAPDYAEPLESLTARLAQITGDLKKELDEHRELNDSWDTSLQDLETRKNTAFDENAGEWRDWMSARETEWENRIRVYDEKMALAAPASYWTGRQSASATAAIRYAVAFCISAAIPLILFVRYGLPHLQSVAERQGISVIVAVLPVLVPAFASIWLLRILGRLLSENIQLMQDAGERVTMVKTFLALMNDEVRGKALVTDDDRLLILHAIFRPSTISATDDAPPVHWFDILSKKLGGSPRS